MGVPIRASGGKSQRPPWSLDRLDQHGPELDGRFTADATGVGVTIYIVDSGIRRAHDEFAGRRAEVGADFVNDGRNGEDCNGHGTHVAGLVGGATYGVAPGARLVALRIADCAGTIRESALLAALTWIADPRNLRRPAVVNLSLVVHPTLARPGLLREMERLVRRAVASGVTFVVAAGNSSTNACASWPARMPEVITVSATDREDARLVVGGRMANYGPCVDLFAPGAAALSAGSAGNGARYVRSGTSAATAYVAGAAALVLERDPGASPAAVAEAVTSAATADCVARPGPGSPNRLLFVRRIAAQATTVAVGARNTANDRR